MKRGRLVGIQYAALPYRLTGRRLSILLVSSRGTRRWVIPKGWPMTGCKPHEAAATEAHEEAGLIGQIADQPLGSYRYMKEIKPGQSIAVQVIVFPFAVEAKAETFKEEGHRAAALVAEPSLRRLILDFGDAQSANPLIWGLHRYRAWLVRRQVGTLPI
jgi:8-oxo-dGTP pyrophosphatase MutT (NUDIX family)